MGTRARKTVRRGCGKLCRQQLGALLIRAQKRPQNRKPWINFIPGEAERLQEFCFIESLSSPKSKNISLYTNSDFRYKPPVPHPSGGALRIVT
jgi:hypothetical protein